MNSQGVTDLLSRGVAQVADQDHLVKRLNSSRKLTIKFGRDPTSSTLTLGHAVPLRKLRQLQLAGHQIVIIIGDFTARLGDPSGFGGERKGLTETEIKRNVSRLKSVFGKILDLKKTKFVYNGDWLRKLSFADVVKLAGSITVQQNIERDLFQRRIEAGRPVGLHEFLYPLMQGYDSIHLKPDLEVGGNDQLFNLLTARQLMKAYGLPEQDILTTLMLEGTDGREMHSSFGNTINLTDSPFDMFGKLMGISDELIIRYFDLTTDLAPAEIDNLTTQLKLGALSPVEAKKTLAREVVGLYHGAQAAATAQQEFESVIQQKGLPTERVSFPLGGAGSINIVDLLIEAGLAKSRSEARRLVEQGGVDLVEVDRGDITNRITVREIGTVVRPHGQRSLVVQVGKRKAIEVWR